MSGANPIIEKIINAFTNLSYDPVLDSDSSVKSWIATHNKGVFYPFVNGEYFTPSKKQLESVFTVSNPFNETPLAKVVNCDEKIVKIAFESARKASASWKGMNYVQRGKIIYNMVRNIQKNPSILIACESVNSGRSSRECKDLDIAAVIKTLYYYAGAVGGSVDTESYDPLGIVAICGYYDSPLLSVVNKLAAALATGNCCVLVPHKLTPLSTYMLAELCVQSGVPSGVVNVVASDSDDIYNLIATSADCVTFDGKTNSGQELPISNSFVNPNTRTLLSLEGKGSLVVYESADIDSAVEAVVDGCFYSNGQHRYSLNKVLVQESAYSDFLERLEARFAKVRTGNHMDKCNDYGPVRTSPEFKELLAKQVESYGANVTQFRENNDDGARLIAPTIIQNGALCSQFNLEQVNGPYVQLVPFRTVKESCDLLNNSKFGSCVAVFSQNVSLVMEVANLLDVGTVWLNSFPVERGVQTRKASGNYGLSGSKSLLNFLKPKYDDFSAGSVDTVENARRRMKSYGTLPTTGTVSEELSIERTYKMYVGGKQTRPDTSNSKPVYYMDSGKPKAYALVPDASRKDVRNAVEAAKSSFNSWWKRANHNKAQILYYIEENFSTRRDQFLSNLELLTGKTKVECQREVDLCSEAIFYFASFCDKYVGQLNDSTEYGYLMEVKEALGVIAIVCGHNAANPNPLLSFVLHMVGAIAHGNSVIVVPDEKFPTLALDLVEIFETSDLPGGVVNILCGSKHHLSKYLCEHQQVNAIWYMNDHTSESIEKRQFCGSDVDAQQFIRYTSNFSFKRSWMISTPLECSESTGFNKVYLDELRGQSTQNKYIHIPMGTIFAN